MQVSTSSSKIQIIDLFFMELHVYTYTQLYTYHRYIYIYIYIYLFISCLSTVPRLEPLEGHPIYILYIYGLMLTETMFFLQIVPLNPVSLDGSNLDGFTRVCWRRTQSLLLIPP